MSAQMTLQQTLTVIETLAANAAQASGVNAIWSAFNVALQNTGATAVPVTTVAGGSIPLVTAAKTLDLTALTALGTAGSTVDMSGLKVQAILLVNPSTNANLITMATGASNGYDFTGGSSSKVTVYPGSSVLIYCADTSHDVDGTHKTIDFAGTGSQPFQIVIVAG